MALPWHLYVMAVIYILAGFNHFRKPGMYERIIPAWLPRPALVNILAGLAEVILGISLCIPQFSAYAAWGVIALLIAIFPANVYMYTNERAAMGLPKWATLARLPLQLLLIVWAWLYT